MEEWKEYRLDTICNLSAGGDAPHNAVKVQTAEMNIPIYSNGESERGLYGYTNSYKVEAPAVTISARGNIGYVCYRKENFVPIVRLITAKANEQILSNEFLYYCLCNTRIWGDGSVQKQLTVPMISEYLVRIPPLSIQSKIVAILKSLDDKIEVNKRINDNLEQQAQALFKSWFVDFEPFRDQPFVESELGMIPEGWRVVSFKDFIEASTEKAPVDCYPEYSVTNNGIIPRNSKFNKKLSKSSSKNKVLKKDELVFGMSREILNWGIMEDEVGGVSSAYNVYKIDKGIVSPTYLRLYMRARISDFNSLIGTAAREGQGLDKGQLMNKHIYIPTNSALQDFLALFLPITEAQLNYENESRRLAELRDTLLPRLMSGELKVNEIENAI